MSKRGEAPRLGYLPCEMRSMVALQENMLWVTMRILVIHNETML